MPKLSDNFSEEGIDDLIAPVCQLADLEAYQEAPDLYDERDEVLDGLILAARKLRDREGFLVVEGDDAGEHEGCGIDSQRYTAHLMGNSEDVTMNTVPESVYLSAVNGRKDMREALRESRESQKATRDSALEEAALYHDRAAAECEAIAKVNRDNDLGASCLTHAADHRIAADNIRAMKSGGTLPPMAKED